MIPCMEVGFGNGGMTNQKTVTGPYCTRIFVNELGADPSSLFRNVPLPDFGGLTTNDIGLLTLDRGHPDPNLTYAEELVKRVLHGDQYDFGCASDGDGVSNGIPRS